MTDDLRTGAHISISKGLTRALDKARDMGANCVQIFSSPPQSFVAPKFSDFDCTEFFKKSQSMDIQPVFIHATYLINLASDDARLRGLSIQSLIDDLVFAKKIGAKGAVVHTGSHKGRGFGTVLPTVKESIRKILEATPPETKLYLEIAAGGGGKIGTTFEELKTMLEAVDNERVGVCLDTAHMFAQGYAFDTPEKVEALSWKIESTIGWERIECMHVNDSKVEFGSLRDRHENLGKGFIGTDTLKVLLAHPGFRKLPLVLETPGFEDKGPDKNNLDILKSLL